MNRHGTVFGIIVLNIAFLTSFCVNVVIVTYFTM